MKKLLFTIVLLLITCTANAGEVWTQVNCWTSGIGEDNPSLTNTIASNTETFKAPSIPWGCRYFVERVSTDKTMPMVFGVVGKPVEEWKYPQSPICVMLTNTGKGMNRIYSKSPTNFLQISAVNCRWTVIIYKITYTKK